MAEVLETELGIKVKWKETQSKTTQENAKFSAKILSENKINAIYLVTNDWHSPRAINIFEKEGLKVIPAPTGFYHHENWTPLHFFPSGEGLNKVRQILHELGGLIWYQLRY